MSMIETAACPSAALRIRGVSKTLGKKRILRDLAFEVPMGSRVLVHGRNGSGKSTLLRVLAGLLKPDSGAVVYGEERMPSEGVRVGYVPQQATVPACLNGHDLLSLAASLYELSPEETGAGVARCREALELDFLDGFIPTYSVGMTKRLLLACALLHDPHLLLLDETLESLDAPVLERLLPFLARLSSTRHMTVVLTSPRRDSYEDFFDVCLHLEDGGIAGSAQAWPEMIR